MLDRTYINAQEALKRILDTLDLTIIQAETIDIEDSYGRILAEDIYSPEDLPGFDRSTVDGYALISEDTFGAKETSPAYLQVKGDILMGVEVNIEITRGECLRVPTGGMLPSGADAVIMFEHTQRVKEDMIEVCKSLSKYENVILHDEDIKKGELVLPKGRPLRSQEVGALAGLGITRLKVYKRPTVSIISTGDEIVPATSPAKKGQVRDINSFTLDGLIRQCGAITIKQGIFMDEYEPLKAVFTKALSESDLVLISGGTSAGIKDMTARIINETGQPGVLFHGVSIKPGKPLIGGIVNHKPVFGLPGHPAAIFVSFDTFISPVLKRLSGIAVEGPPVPTLKATIAKSLSSTAGREDHIRVSLSRDTDGRYIATPILGKSGLIRTLIKADGIVVIEAHKLGMDAGQEVDVRLF